MWHPRKHPKSPKCSKTGKVGWASKVDAEMARDNAKFNKSRSFESTFEKRSYRCQFCGAWHTTSQEKHNVKIA